MIGQSYGKLVKIFQLLLKKHFIVVHIFFTSTNYDKEKTKEVQSMDHFENEELRQESEYSTPQPQQTEYQPPVEQPYSGAGVGRKESPFADSPYVMNRPSGQYYSQNPGYVPPVPPEQPPVKKPKTKKLQRKPQRLLKKQEESLLKVSLTVISTWVVELAYF